jgi:hypothetical protein
VISILASDPPDGLCDRIGGDLHGKSGTVVSFRA